LPLLEALLQLKHLPLSVSKVMPVFQKLNIAVNLACYVTPVQVGRKKISYALPAKLEKHYSLRVKKFI